MAPRAQFAIFSALLAFLVVALYWPVRDFEFLDFDDHLYATNAKVLAGLSLDGVRWAFTTFDASNWHPLTWLSHMLDVQLFGLNAGARHLVNVLLHALNTILLFWFIRVATGATWPAAFCAALFACHPLRVESVAWIAERKDLLFACFGLLSLIAYLQCHRRQRPSLHWLALLFFALSLLSKPMLVTLPFILLLMDWWFLQRWNPADLPQFHTHPGARQAFLRLCVEKWPFFLLTLGSCVLTVLAQRSEIAVMQEVGFGYRVANAFISYVRYLGTTFWPLDLASLYPLPPAWTASEIVGSAALLAAITWLACRWMKESPHLAGGWFWFLGTLVPVIGLVQVGNQSMADRYTYFPHIGLLIGGVFAVRGMLPVASSAVVAAFALIACFALTRAQLPHWRTSLALHSRSVAVTRDNYTAHLFLGNAMMIQKQFDQARHHYETALRIRPVFPRAYRAHQNLATLFAFLGRHDEAFEHIHSAVRLNPRDPDLLNSLGIALTRRNDLAAAEQCFREALRLNSAHESAKINLGLALGALDRQDEALQCFLDLERRGSTDPRVYYQIAWAAGRNRDFIAARRHLETALRLKPDDLFSLQFLAAVHEETGDAAAALRCYREAARHHPANPTPQLALAWFLINTPDAPLRDPAQAVSLAERARELSGAPTVQLLDILASVYAAAGDFEKATQTMEQLMPLAEPDARARLQERLKLYQSRRAKPK
ncbi:MAG: tetratricopeptide repeat protein [Verrucomicrobiota bacterium]